MLLALDPRGGDPSAVLFADTLRHGLAWDDMEQGSFGHVSETHEDVEVIPGLERLSLLVQYPLLGGAEARLALDGDGATAILACGEDVDENQSQEPFGGPPEAAIIMPPEIPAPNWDRPPAMI